MTATELESLRTLAHALAPDGLVQARQVLDLLADRDRLLHASKYALKFLEEYDTDREFHPSLYTILRAAIAGAKQ